MSVISINAEELSEMIKKGKDSLEIIDVREPEEYAIISIKGSKLIPSAEFEKNIEKIDWSKKVVFICRSGGRSRVAAGMAPKEKEIFILSGGIVGFYNSGNKEDLQIDENKIEEYL